MWLKRWSGKLWRFPKQLMWLEQIEKCKPFMKMDKGFRNGTCFTEGTLPCDWKPLGEISTELENIWVENRRICCSYNAYVMRTFYALLEKKCYTPSRTVHVPECRERFPRHWLQRKLYYPYSKVHGPNMEPTWVLLVPTGPHVGPMNLAFRVYTNIHDKDNQIISSQWSHATLIIFVVHSIPWDSFHWDGLTLIHFGWISSIAQAPWSILHCCRETIFGSGIGSWWRHMATWNSRNIGQSNNVCALWHQTLSRTNVNNVISSMKLCGMGWQC